MTADDVALMRTRVVPTVPQHVKALKPVYLFHANKDVNDCNDQILVEIEGESAESVASDVPSGSHPNGFQRTLKSLKEKKPQDTKGLSYKLLLKVGGRYMMTSNLDTGDVLVNGSLGYLRRIDCGIHVDDPGKRKASRL